MAINNLNHVRQLVVIALCLFIVVITVTIGVAVWYTRSQVQHECEALDILIAQPIQPYTQKNVDFHNALVQWHDENGC